MPSAGPLYLLLSPCTFGCAFATCLPSSLPPQQLCLLLLLVQGRISRRVTVPLPDEGGRAAILGVHLRDVTLDESAGDKTQVARQLAALTTGFSGAACHQLLFELLLGSVVTTPHIDQQQKMLWWRFMHCGCWPASSSALFGAVFQVQVGSTLEVC